MENDQASAAPQSEEVHTETSTADLGQPVIDFKDPLLDCLVIYTKLNRHPFSKDALISGLPLANHDRLTPELFIRAAERANIVASFKKRALQDIPNLVMPCILTLKNNQACLLEKIDFDTEKATIILSDAPDGRLDVDLHQLEKDYLGYAIYFTEKFQQASKKEDLISTGQGHWFWHTFWDNRGIYRDVLIASVIINIFVLANPLFVMNVYDRIVPNNAVESLWVLAIGISVVYMFDILLKFLRSYFLEMAGKKSDVIMSSKLFEQTLGLTMANRQGSIGAFANNLKEFDSIRNFFTSGTIASLVDLPFVIIFLLVIFFIAGQIVLVPIAIIGLILVYSIVMKKPIQSSVEATYEASSQKNAVLIETLTAIETIKSLGVEAHSQWKWEQAVGEIARASLKSKMLQSSIGRVTGFMQQMSTVVIVLVGVYLIKDGLLTMGGLIATVMLSQRAIGPMGQFASLTSTYQQTKTALDSLNELMKKEVERPAGKRFIQHPVFEGTIEFVDVTFTYPGETKPALNNVSFKLNPGEKLGIIGRIGSGKSTVEKLILGFYHVDSGSILIDGIDITQLDPAELRRNINYVPQDVTLFSGDVRENIAYRAPYVEDSEILRAAKLAGVDDFIKTHPSGYSLKINEGGGSLSGGQRQSIGVARALLLDTPIYLFDEPTNAMDANTEQTMIDRLKKGTLKNTTIVVTHKMSLLQLVDRLIVMSNGKVIADGSKATVLEALKTGRINKA
ncbi:Toxin RTX-I translocation ATP-binding protein [Hydrogenovibrio crunogenus]|uniref:Toxin RTX-I translocation ATP-binding protein n=1 Tax=Hydrogenovibrio crunogenus TaxID=39765 RepID=A0A4V1C8K2_9GAMM|nr:type I secretion system permease/ATPase [Hydrogenovibrio crunogenus]QBZ82194.1 Toxin RTX-I translocation ATP-binding protein [Hydrogenovibrio crunogenus]